MEENHSTRLGSLIFIGVVLDIVKWIFVYPKMQHEFKGFYIQGDTLFDSICWTASLWFGYFVGTAIIAGLLYLVSEFIIDKCKHYIFAINFYLYEYFYSIS